MASLVKINSIDKYAWVHGYYYVSRYGFIFNAKTGKRIQPYNQGCGRCQVWLYGKGVHKKEYVYRVVAEAFVPNPFGKPDINHLDENPNNNRADNLEWCTKRENNQYGSKELRRKVNVKKKIVGLFSDNEIRVFTRDQLRAIFGSITPILRCCNSLHEKCKRYRGVWWSYQPIEEKQLSFNF